MTTLKVYRGEMKNYKGVIIPSFTAKKVNVNNTITKQIETQEIALFKLAVLLSTVITFITVCF
jgi:hypothetical protein